jgi:PAS domain S-box-containing protein
VVLNPRSANGEVIPTSLNASASRGPDGRAISVIGILRDMRELDKARAYAESLIKNVPDPVFVSDLEGKILQANDGVFALLGFPPDELIEQSLSRIISPDETREFLAALREVVERGVTRNARLNSRNASGEGIPQQVIVEGEVQNGSFGADGTATFSGAATVNMGDGTPPLLGVPFTVKTSTLNLGLTLGTNALPTAALTAGSVTIE